jgi:hypothetical protein
MKPQIIQIKKDVKILNVTNACISNNTTITNSNLSGVIIDDCNIKGMKIFGLLMEDLFREYQKPKQ